MQASWNWPFDRKDMEVYGQTGYVDHGEAGRHSRTAHGRGGDAKESHEEQVAAKPLPPPYDNSLSYLRAVILDGEAGRTVVP